MNDMDFETFKRASDPVDDLRKAQALSKIGSWRYDIVNDILIWSDEVYKIFQIDKELYPVKKLDDFFSKVDPEYIDLVDKAYSKHLKEKVPYELTHELCLDDGTRKWIHEKCETLYDNNGNPVESHGILQDITEKHKLDEEIASSHELLRKLTKNVPGSVYQFVLHPDGHSSIPYSSAGMAKIFGIEPHEVVDNAQAVFDIIHPDDLNMVQASIKSSAESMSDWNVQYRICLSGEDIHWLEGFSKPEKLEDGTILWHGYVHDITARKHAEDELKRQKDILNFQAHHDSLTELPNRALFQNRLEEAIEKAKRSKSKFALLFIDLDHFKEINDSLGHDIGDEILKTVTLRLKRSKRYGDTLARLGGDEFTIILEGLEQIEDASKVSSKILENLSKPIQIDDNVLYVSTSIGISVYPDDSISVQSLLKFADSAMYKAKSEGRNNYQFYNSTLT